MHPAVLLILAALSERGATLYQDGAALIIDHWPGTVGPALERAISLHETELLAYATPVDPWADGFDVGAPTEPCGVCGGFAWFRAGDNVTAWVCERCQPQAARASYQRALKADERKETQMTVVRGRRYPRSVRPWERKAG